MSPLMIAQLVIQLGPTAFQFIQDLMGVWSKPELTLEEVNKIVQKAEKSYQTYLDEARAGNV